MSFFTSLRDSEFSRAAFAAAGVDFDAAVKANNVDVLKTALVAAKPSVDLVTAEAALKDAVTENKEISARNAQLVAAFTAVGANPEKPETLKATIATQVTEQVTAQLPKAAREFVAKSGHPVVEDEISTASAQKRGDAKSITRTAFNALTAADRLAQVKAGVVITD